MKPGLFTFIPPAAAAANTPRRNGLRPAEDGVAVEVEVPPIPEVADPAALLPAVPSYLPSAALSRGVSEGNTSGVFLLGEPVDVEVEGGVGGIMCDLEALAGLPLFLLANALLLLLLGLIGLPR